ncbi:MAG TPA: cupin domain-containing protein [Patescibacteria group bacterium]|nr:cupin domain-containing protein [Patescibacteria group bacterium]
MGFIANVNQQSRDNTYFRRVLDTGEHTQVVIMHIPAGGEIGSETHADNDQVLYLLDGKGKAILSGQEYDYNTGDVVLVPAGTEHNFVANPDSYLKIITTYSPPHHPANTVHQTKADAEKADY